MEQSPSREANRFVASQEIPRKLWNPKLHHPIHKYPPPVSILSQLNSAHIPTSHFLKIRLNIILPTAPGSTKWSLSLRFSHLNPIHASSLPPTRYMSRPSHLTDHITFYYYNFSIKKYHKTACTVQVFLRTNLDVRNMSKTLQLN
jgi:hypothetical protein